MSEVFRKVVDDEGNESYEPVAVTEIEIPEEVVREHPAYKNVLTESVERRQKLSEANKRLQSLIESNENDDDNESEGESAPPPEVPAIDVEALVNQAVERTTAELEKRQREAAERQGSLNTILRENHLDDDEEVRTLLLQLDPEKAASVAKVLAKRALRFDDTPGGSGDLRRKPLDFSQVAKNLDVDD